MADRDMTRRVRLRLGERGDMVFVADAASGEDLVRMPLGDLMAMEAGVDYVAVATILGGEVDVLSTTIRRDAALVPGAGEE